MKKKNVSFAKPIYSVIPRGYLLPGNSLAV